MLILFEQPYTATHWSSSTYVHTHRITPEGVKGDEAEKPAEGTDRGEGGKDNDGEFS